MVSVPSVQRGEHFPIGLKVRSRYRVVSQLGAGAFGTVCLAEDESTGHRVAIRFFPRSFGNAPHATQAVLRTGRSIISASASHPGLGRVLEFGEVEAGRPFAVVELIEGRRLSEIIADGQALDVPSALRLALELGGAVETLHNMGFIHGALCPRNVMVLDDGRVKLMDVELAGLRDARELQGLVAAEPQAEYLSPEQIQKAPVSEKTDIYAFGAILYELLSGKPPFHASTREAILGKHLKEAPAPIHRRRNGVPGSVERAVTLALYKQPEPRPLMGDVLNLLWTGAHGPAPRSKRVTMIATGSALAVVAVVAVIWGALALRPETTPPVARPAGDPLPVRPAPVPTVPVVDTRTVPSVLPPASGVVPPRAPALQPVGPPAAAPEPRPLPAVKPVTPAEAPPPARAAAPPPAQLPPAPVVAPPLTRSPVGAPPTTAAGPGPRPLPAVKPATPEMAPPPARAAAPPPASVVAPPAARPPVSTSPAPAATAPEPRPLPAARPTTPEAAPAPAARAAAPPLATTPEVARPPASAPAPQRGPDDPNAVIDWLLNPSTRGR